MSTPTPLHLPRLGIDLLCRPSGVMNRHSRINRQKDNHHDDEHRSHCRYQNRRRCRTGAHVAPEKGTAKRAASQKKAAPKANKRAKKAAPKRAAKLAASKRAAKKPVQPASKRASQPATEACQGSKKATILQLLRRPKGATLTEIAEATNWQNHSIRGFLSGSLRKKMGLTIESSKNQAGDRRYRIGN